MAATDNNGGEAGPWKPVKIPRDKPWGSKNTVNEKWLTFRLWSHRIPTNAVSPPTLAGLTATVQTLEPLCKQRERSAVQ